MSRIYYIYADDHETFVTEQKVLDVWSSQIEIVPFSRYEQIDLSLASHLLVTGTIDEIKQVMDMAKEGDVSLGIVPLPEQKELIRTFALPTKTEEALRQALEISEKRIDLLYCNDSLVLQEVVIGDVPPLDQFDTTLKGKTFFDRIKLFWHTIRTVKTLKHTEMTITDAKENEIKFSAVGVVCLKYNNATFAAKLISSQCNASDGKLSMVILSPISIMQYMGYLFKSLVSHLTPDVLPRSVGYIRSSRVHIESKAVLDVLVDGHSQKRTPVTLEVKEKALKLSTGEAFWQSQGKEQGSKDSIRIDHLPSDEESADYLSKSIPLFSHASQEQYRLLFSHLREEGRLNSIFMILLILSTMIATLGLFTNSSSVVIGAMLLAPLMQPIVSLSMGILRQDSTMEINGAKTIFTGILAVLLTAALIACFMPMERLTAEMAGRLSPTILDLFIAIVSGAAAAYAKSNEKIVGSLAGVAIAVALVPPLAVAGIGLGWLNWHMFGMAFLLFVTNLVGIVLSAALTFVLLGFSPLHIAKKGIMIWMAIVMVVAIPLYGAFMQMKEDILIQSTLSNLSFDLGEHRIKLTQIQLIHHPKEDELRCEVVTTGRLSIEEKRELKEIIIKRIGKQVGVIVTFRYRL